MNALVGYTGFVGSNLYASGQFEAVYHSKNIENAYGTHPKLLVYAGLRAEKYLAGHEPEKDLSQVCQAQKNIAAIGPENLVLISTIDVFKDSKGADEKTDIQTDGLHPYGLHRYQLEQWVREQYPEALVIRLPGLFGKNIKKNFIYDFINIIPSVLTEAKMNELAASDPTLWNYYMLQENGLYKVKKLTEEEREILKERFQKLGFSALNFTDSRSVYQFYYLGRLWNDIQTALHAGLRLWHPATEPVSAGELYTCLTGKTFINKLGGIPANYGFRTLYAELFGGHGGYISSRKQVIEEIREFIGCMKCGVGELR